MDEELLAFLHSNIATCHKHTCLRAFKKIAQDKLDEMAFWEAENAKWDSVEIFEEDSEPSFAEVWEYQTKIGHQW